MTFYSFLFIYIKYCELFANQTGIICSISGPAKNDAVVKCRHRDRMAYQNVKDQVRSGLEPLEMERSDQRKDKNRNASEEPDDTVLKKEIDEISGRIDSILNTIENHFPSDRNEKTGFKPVYKTG